jgi:hypothetical protein
LEVVVLERNLTLELPLRFTLIVYMHEAGFPHVILDIPVVKEFADIVIDPGGGVMMELLRGLG